MEDFFVGGGKDDEALSNSRESKSSILKCRRNELMTE